MSINNLDDAVTLSSKHLAPLQPWVFMPLLNLQVMNGIYTAALPGHAGTKTALKDRIYHSNNPLWEAIIREKVRAEMYLTLECFFLFEWLPLSPGLIHTQAGKEECSKASSYVESVENGVIVYDPWGKACMLNGGVGNVRLKPIDGYYFVSASSSGTCHEGFPVAIPADQFGQMVGEIEERGCVVRTLVGKLRFIPDDLLSLYSGYNEVPHLYLEVEQVRMPANPKSRTIEEFKISVAVSFLSQFEGPARVYASYVNFDPARKLSFQESVQWMEQNYVHGRYRGQVLTDFDEQKSHFLNAPFSLRKIMALQLNWDEVRAVAPSLGVNPRDLQRFLTAQESLKVTINITKESYMGPKYNISGGQFGAVGDHAHAHDFTQLWNQNSAGVSLPDLAQELAALQTEAEKRATKPDQFEVVGSLKAAALSAENGEGPKVLQFLAKGGKWALDLAKEIGKSVAAKAIETAMGITSS